MTGADRSTPGEDLEMALLEGGIKGSTNESTKGRPVAGTAGRGRPALEIVRAALVLRAFGILGIGFFGGPGCDLDSRLLEGRDAGTATIDTSGGTGGRGTGGHPSSVEPDGSGGRALVGSGGEAGSPVADTGGSGAGGAASAPGEGSGGAGGTEAPGSGGLPGGSGGAGAGGPGGMTLHASGGTMGASGGAGGAPSTGGRTGSGGVIGPGGATATGGKGSGGVTASGGTTATGGATAIGTGGATGPAILSIDFVGGVVSTTGVVIPAPALDPSDSAGVKAAKNWNPAGAGMGIFAMLTLADGTVSSATVMWDSPPSATEKGVWRINLTDAHGDARMMNGYLDPLSPSAPATVNVSNLPAPFSTRGYDVYVYSLGDIPDGATRTSKYTIGSTSIVVSQMGPTPTGAFTGFKRAQNNGSGNYMVFQSVTGASFTLTATPSTGTPTRAPVNGIQIVSPPGS